MKDVIRADGFVLSHSKGNLLTGQVNKQPEETKGWNKEDNQDQDSLTDRKQGQEINKYFCCKWEKCFLETKQLVHKMILNKIQSEENSPPPSHLLFLE